MSKAFKVRQKSIGGWWKVDRPVAGLETARRESQEQEMKYLQQLQAAERARDEATGHHFGWCHSVFAMWRSLAVTLSLVRWCRKTSVHGAHTKSRNFHFAVYCEA